MIWGPKDKSNIIKITLIFCVGWLIFVFAFSKHYGDRAELTETWMAYQGLSYYRDIPVYHFPFGRISLIPIHNAFHWTFEDSPFIALSIGIGTLFILYYFGREFLSKYGRFFSLLFFTFFFWFCATLVTYDHEMMIGFFLICSLFTFFRILRDKYTSVRKIFLLGFFSGLTLTTGQVSGITVITLLVLTIVVLNIKKHLKGQLFWKSLFWLFLGFLIPVIILILYVVRIDALPDFYKWNFTYYLTYARDDKPNLLQLPWKELSILYSSTLILGILILIKFFKKRAASFTEIATFLLALSSLPFVLFSVFHYRHLLFCLPLLGISTGLIFNQISQHERDSRFLSGIWAVIFLLACLFVIIPYQSNYFIFPPSAKLFNETYPGDNMYEAVGWIKENTKKDAKIMVLGDSLFYIRSDRLPASRPNSSIPFSWVPIEQIKKEIQARPPDFWITDQLFIDKLRSNYPKFNLMSFIDTEMLHCYSIEKTFGGWKIWKKVC